VCSIRQKYGDKVLCKAAHKCNPTFDAHCASCSGTRAQRLGHATARAHCTSGLRAPNSSRTPPPLDTWPQCGGCDEHWRAASAARSADQLGVACGGQSAAQHTPRGSSRRPSLV